MLDGARRVLPRTSPVSSTIFMLMDEQFYLSEHIYIALADRHCVFLDSHRDKYLAIVRRDIESLGPWLAGWDDGAEHQAVQSLASRPSAAQLALELVQANILTTAPERGKLVRPESLPSPVMSLEINSQVSGIARASYYTLLSLASLLKARQILRARRLEEVIRRVAVRRRKEAAFGHTFEEDKAKVIVSSFHRIRAYYSRERVCLFDSFALLELFAEFQIFPRWVFAIAAEPFEAHCWLQEGNIVLNDSIERVSAYTPIMSV